MPHHDMDISRLMVYAKKSEETKLRKIKRDGKTTRSEEQGQLKSKNRFYNQNSPIVSKDGVSNPNSQGRTGGASSIERYRCTPCGK